MTVQIIYVEIGSTIQDSWFVSSATLAQSLKMELKFALAGNLRKAWSLNGKKRAMISIHMLLVEDK